MILFIKNFNVIHFYFCELPPSDFIWLDGTLFMLLATPVKLYLPNGLGPRVPMIPLTAARFVWNNFCYCCYNYLGNWGFITRF